MPEAPVTPDLTAAYASRRFFISSPGRSNSIVDSQSTTSSPEEDTDTPPAMAGGVAVETYSPDPYVDFRRSMQEMVEAREVAREGVREAWEYLQELLLSYLSLNPKGTHKYIVRAFADLVVSSMSPIINHNINNCSDNNSAYVQLFNHAI
ncbi:transcription repressor OFP16-like [Silene latifolia]|uniref:transcription repressor OFP16-like n=1 Tax=Silene latifolia TaxID=37657 RepID=UPI003D786A76